MGLMTMMKMNPRVVVVGCGAGLERVVTGLATRLAGRGGANQTEWLTAIVPSARDLDECPAVTRRGIAIYAASSETGPARRVAPDALRQMINADLIVFGPCDRAPLDDIIAIGGVGRTLPAVKGIRVLVTPLASENPRVGERYSALFASRLFHYWLSGSCRSDSTDGLIDDLIALLEHPAGAHEHQRTFLARYAS